METRSPKRRRRPRSALPEHYQVILAVALIILLAGSLLYCLGFASLAARHALQSIPSPDMSAIPGVDELDETPVVTATETISPTEGVSVTATAAISPGGTIGATPTVTAGP